MQNLFSETKNKSSKDRFLLTRSYAFERSKYIENLSYQLCFYFQSSSESYKVDTTLTFSLKSKVDLILECGVYSIKTLHINGFSFSSSLIDQIWKENALYIPKNYLRDGENTFVFKTISKFSRDSSGFHSYTHNTNSQICYTVCPPNYAHLIYPCFDQPDIKGTFDLKVKAPAQWTVISNSPVSEVKNDGFNLTAAGTLKWWTFHKTPKISTYLFSIAAGNFMEIKPKRETEIPMRLYCGEHRHQYLYNQKDEFFDLVEAGIKFYSKFFGTPFPFQKYDQIFCPEFKYLGMENPGMVCLTENYIFMTHVSAFKMSQRALTVLHELSHMWFGDLVTMKWWDNIWLNEGFASFISYHTLPIVSKDDLANTIDIKFLFYKQEALYMDTLESTHPVEQDVKDTEAATNIFDDITYCKGSAVIKHLMYIIGEENFSRALTCYFQRFAWGNADSRDFFHVIQEILDKSEDNMLSIENEEGTDEMMKKWIHDWLETEGKLNIFSSLSPSGNGITLEIEKKSLPKRIATEKHINLEMALFHLDEEDNVTKSLTQRLYLKDDQTTLELPLKNFDFKDIGVILNYKDNAYAEIIIDDHSTQFFLRNSRHLEPLLRAQIFVSMIKKVEFGQINPVDLFTWIAEELTEERIPYLFSEYLVYATKLMDCYLPMKLKVKCGKILFDKVYSILTEYNSNTDKDKEELVITVQEYITNFACENNDMLLLVAWLQKKNTALSRIAPSGVMMGRIIEEIFLRKLLSDSGRNEVRNNYIRNHPYYVNFTSGASASLKTKTELWEKFVSFKSSHGSHFEFSCQMKGVNNPHDEGISLLAQRFFDDLLKVFENNENEYCNIFFTNLFPKIDDPNFIIERIEDLMEKALPYANLKNLLEEKLYQTKVSRELE